MRKARTRKAIDESAAWRASLYHALALAFSYPTTETLEDLLLDLDDLATHRLTLESRLGPAVEALRDACASTTVDEVAVDHNRLFAGDVPCSPCETDYEFDAFAKARQLADISGFYRAFGLKPAADDAAPADFIATELDFMAHLVLKEAWAEVNGWDERRDIVRETRRAFMEDHLGRWVPLFCRELVAIEDIDSFFGAAACVCDAAIALDVLETGANPRPALARRVAPDQAEPLTCPLATTTFAEEEDEQ
jgi:TorA maturation chaperone TorD